MKIKVVLFGREWIVDDNELINFLSANSIKETEEVRNNENMKDGQHLIKG